MMARRPTTKITDSDFGISEVRSRLCGADNAGLASSLPRLPVGLACHRRSSEYVGENETSLLTGGVLFVGMISEFALSRLFLDLSVPSRVYSTQQDG